MDPQILKFLDKERICVLTTMLRDGTPHSATVNFCYSNDPELRIYISTYKSSRKMSFYPRSVESPASIAIGFSQVDWQTFQLDGVVKIIENFDLLAKVKELYYGLHPDYRKYDSNPDTIFLEFTSSWTRFSDFQGDSITNDTTAKPQ